MNRALVIAHPADRDPGFVGPRLVERGWRLTEADRERPGGLPDPARFDLVVSLGSDWSVYQPSVRAEVEAEAAALRAAHGRGTPVLGICWGAQLLAHALGARVAPAPAPEVGWQEVVPTPGSAIEPGPWFQWHVDAFEVPGDSTLLAGSAVGPQAFVAGRSLATQFHPELTEAMLVRWVAGAREAPYRLLAEPERLLDASTGRWDAAAHRTRHLVDWFLDDVVGRATTPPPRRRRERPERRERPGGPGPSAGPARAASPPV